MMIDLDGKRGKRFINTDGIAFIEIGEGNVLLVRHVGEARNTLYLDVDVEHLTKCIRSLGYGAEK